ncbi:hypothetical protein [Mycobacteroides abscessus]|uniref:hypothetical protein n=1 Tax=Mycobacteroides abscessus TaxID=36809 RepID=UPI00157BF947|nr:hypothetical protein [Mycobacteroides abscessus]MDQ8119603.1 hypothetical protein [Mycobacteroides abscessus subsp. massiliense]
MTEIQVELTTNEANRLRKWGSLWLDLLHVYMTLHQRLNTPDIPSNAFTRRALWESSVVSYGRMESSDRKRKLEHHALLTAAGCDCAFHEQIMQWRHGHVAHRLSNEFEETATVAVYVDGNSELESLNLHVSTWVGPPDASTLVTAFLEHVTKLRDALWKTYLAPIGETLAKRQQAITELGPQFEGLTTTERLMVNCTLWARSNGTGIPRLS